MKKSCTLLVFSVLLCGVFAAVSLAQDVVYIDEPTFSDIPKILPRTDASLWNEGFRDNPALLTLSCPYEFISDAYYLGSAYKITSGGFSEGFSYTYVRPSYIVDYVDSTFISTVLGGDTGAAMKLNDRANLALILSYRYGNVWGESDVSLRNYFDTTLFSWYDGLGETKVRTNDFALSALYRLEMSDRLALGFGLKWSYRDERTSNDFFGAGYEGSPPHTFVLDYDRDLALRYGVVSPVVGVSFKPAENIDLDARVSAGWYFGDVKKSIFLYDGASNNTHTEDLDSGTVAGWEVGASVSPTIAVTGALSIPVVLDFAYRDVAWSVDGSGSGNSYPYAMDLIYHGTGLVSYENDEATWHITAGAGVTYDAGWAALSAMLSYTRWEFRNTYDQDLYVTAAMIGHTFYTRRDTETRDIAALELSMKKDFSPAFSADFSVKYLLGWAQREYHVSYMSLFEEFVPHTLHLDADGRDLYQDLVLSAAATFKPSDRLSLSLKGSVTVPLDELDYALTGSGSGLEILYLTGSKDVYIDGPVTRKYVSDGWQWGLYLSLDYEFGCAAVVPPTAPAPVIAPKLEPMSSK